MADGTGITAEQCFALCMALVELGLLEGDEQAYRPGRLAAEHLVGSAPTPMRNWVVTESWKLKGFAGLTQALTGKQDEDYEADRVADGLPTAQQMALADIAHDNADSVAAAVNLLVPGGQGRVLDAGGGHGTYSIDLVNRLPGWQATIGDRPGTVELAAANVALAGLTDSIDTRVIDIYQAPFGQDYDMVFMFMVLCGADEERSITALQNAYATLRPGGWLLLRGFYWRDRLEEAMFSLKHMLRPGGQLATSAEDMAALVRKAGFVDPRLLEGPKLEADALMAAQRPS